MDKPGKPFLIIFIAVAIVAALSLLPWSRMTGRVFKDFNLLADIMPGAVADDVEPEAEPIDSLLLADAKNATNTPAAIDTAIVAPIAPRQGDKVLIEDYSADKSGLKHLRGALADVTKRPVRIAVIGDSYIEGDIMTQDLRQMFQDRYGGAGVGYMPVQTALAGFRNSVKHEADGWNMYDLRKTTDPQYRWLAGTYGVSTDKASATFKGSKKTPHLDQWNQSRILVMSPTAATVNVTTDANGAQTYSVPANQLACVKVDGLTSQLSLQSTTPGLVVLGVWLGNATGVTVENMSIRGDSGISHRALNDTLSRDMAAHIDYDLIIIEYGINALSAAQHNYTHYSNVMVDVINKVRQCYPQADILLMGIGDRGQKHGTEVHSMSTAPKMVEAQRMAARRAQVMFYDTREAMGGEDAVVDWRNRGLVNADYIHMSRKGGHELATLIYEAINTQLGK